MTAVTLVDRGTSKREVSRYFGEVMNNFRQRDLDGMNEGGRVMDRHMQGKKTNGV